MDHFVASRLVPMDVVVMRVLQESGPLAPPQVAMKGREATAPVAALVEKSRPATFSTDC